MRRLLSTVIVLGVALAACNQGDLQDIADDAESALRGAAQELEDLAGEAEGTLRAAADRARETADEARQAAEDFRENPSDETRQALEEAKSTSRTRPRSSVSSGRRARADPGSSPGRARGPDRPAAGDPAGARGVTETRLAAETR